MNHRLFFALWPDDAVRRRIDAAAAAVECAHAPGGRRLRRDRLHLTLQFLGDFAPVPAGLVEAACEAASRIDCGVFSLTLDQAGSFPGSRVWWLGCRACPAELQALWSALGEALGDAGVPLKAHPRFTPHVTIQRNARRSLARTPVAPVEWPVSDFVLIDSRPEAGYVRLARWPLRG
jgi:2'-5' RNA ligase